MTRTGDDRLHDGPGDDDLDLLLDSSSPATTPDSPALDDALRQMTAAAAQQPRSRGRLRTRRAAFVATTTAVALVGVGAAAASTGVWQPWAQDPDGVYALTLPSGATCEYRVVATGKSGAALREIFATEDVVALADVDAVIADARAAGQWITDDDGVEHPAGPGTEWYSADWEYFTALGIAFPQAVQAAFEARDVPFPEGFESMAQAECDGAQW